MSALKISRVMAVSSEDPQFPATNLLTGGEWRCLGTEEEAWVLLLLEHCVTGSPKSKHLIQNF